jgi:hypothetical protein
MPLSPSSSDVAGRHRIGPGFLRSTPPEHRGSAPRLGFRFCETSGRGRGFIANAELTAQFIRARAMSGD